MAGDASWAFSLPNNNVAPGQALETAIGRKQQMDLQEMEANERRKSAQLKQQQDNSTANMTALNKRTDDILKGQTLSSFVNNRTSDEINNIYDEFSKLAATGMSPSQYQGALANRLLGIGKWHNSAMTASEQIVEQAKVLAGGTSNLDQEAVLNIGANSLAKNLFNPDGSMKNPDLLPNDINHFTDLKDENLRGLVTKSSEAFYDFFKKHPQSDISDKDFSSNKGYSEFDKWKGKALGDFTEPEFDDKGKALRMNIKSETIPGMKDGEGKPLKILPETLYKQLQADDQVGNAMAKMWTENSMKERFNWMVANGKTKTTSQDEELIKKNFYLKQANTAIPSAIQREEANVIPSPPRISIYNQPQNSPAAQWVNDMYTAAASGNEQYVKGVASQLFSGMGKNEFEGDVFLLTAEQTGDRPAIQINYKGAIKGKDIFGKDTEEIGRDYERIYLDDPNIKTKLAGLYQKIMGATGKVEDANFYKNQQPIINKTLPPKPSVSNVPSFLKKN